MTTQEMMEMRISGATYQEIADACGRSKQDVHERVTRYSKRVINGYRGHGFVVEDIKYKGIREHFENNINESINSFAKKVGVLQQTMSEFLKGKTESRFTIRQIKRMCEIVGKPFEEVFGGADDE